MKRFHILLTLAILLIPISSTHAQGVDILWQGETYTPPFYNGKFLFSTQSRITLVAIPQSLNNHSALNYKWIQNGTVLGKVSGAGKNTLSFTDSIISRPQTIEIEIYSSQSDLLAKSSVYLKPIAPTIYVYENNPLYGYMFNKEVGELFKFKEKETTFSAFPFFFSTSNRTSATVDYKWFSDNVETGVDASATYLAPENTSGSSKISVSVSSSDKITQRKNKSFVVQFEK